jgi:glyoxylase I family protein
MWWSHVGLNCVDQARTEAFYTRWFGFRRARVVPIGDGEIIFLKKGDGYLELFPTTERKQPGKADGPQTPGLARHIAFQIENVDELLDEMGDAAELTLGPLGFDEIIPGWRTVWMRDPDGVIVEVSQGFRE